MAANDVVSFELELKKNFDILRIVRDVVNRTCSENGPRNIMSYSLYLLAYEHARSIMFLAQKKHNSSALALLRPTMEALLKGAWVAHGASDALLQKWVHDLQLTQTEPKFPLFQVLYNSVEKNTPSDLRAAITALYEAFPQEHRNDWTHGGIFQITQQLHGKKIAKSLQAQMLNTLLQGARLALAASALGIADLTGDPEYLNDTAIALDAKLSLTTDIDKRHLNLAKLP